MSLPIERLYELFLECSSVSTDTRKITPDCLFIALKGPNYNANRFAAEALERGARYALVDEESYANQQDIFLVGQGLEALQKLAQFHRKNLQIPIIGITGSNGKTTTKELIYQVLSTRYRTFATHGNLNNHIGVPLSILSIGDEIELAVIEMGANHVGEIAALCNICRPTHGLITNIGHAHIEGFGGFEGVIRGKSELYHYLIENQGIAFINSEDKILSNMARRFQKPVFYPSQHDFLHIVNEGADPYLKFRGERNLEVTTQLIGAYNFHNVAAALCIGKFFKVPMALAEQAVADYQPVNNRSQVLTSGTNTIILDAYNANPSSMGAALDNLLSMKSKHRAVILGDMMELGDESMDAHREMVEKTRAIDLVLLCGSQMGKAKKHNPQALHFEDKEGLINYLSEHPLDNATILVKASRGMEMEKVVPYI